MATSHTVPRRASRTRARVPAPPAEVDSAAVVEPPPQPVEIPPRRQVLIDGIPYEPASPAHTRRYVPRAGLAITTHNRNELLGRCLTAWRSLTPPDWPIIIVDDASDKPVDGADYRFDSTAGVPVAKNKSLELLMAHPARLDHLFLLDDDVLPNTEEWWRPYVESPEPHLAHSWGLQVVGGDALHDSFHASGGTVLYFTREVVEDVGGMRADFGPDGQPAWGCEHVNLSDRIHNRGHTTWRYADVKGSGKLFIEMDRAPQRSGHTSTATSAQRDHNRTAGRELWQRRLFTDDSFVEYRTDGDVVLTCLFTNRQAQLSGRRLRPSTEPLSTLASSIHHGRLAVFHDQLPEAKLATGNPRWPSTQFIQAECTVNVFFQRWITYGRWLAEHPEIARVWCVDGTDVTQLADPFTDLEPDKLHIGWEPATLESSWLREHHPEQRVHEFMINNPGLQLLNPGVVGGSRAVMLEFCRAMGRYCNDVAIDAAQQWQPRISAKVGAGDVPAANLIAYTRFADRLVTGTKITTVFKAFEDQPKYSLWSHK